VRAGQRQNVSRHGTAAAVASFFFLKFAVILRRIFSPMLSALTTSDEPLHFGSSGTSTFPDFSLTHFQWGEFIYSSWRIRKYLHTYQTEAEKS
jgi:hypothetical protein